MTVVSRVNIIFVRGMVRTCLPFLRSMIDVTNLPLRLVANGCEADEEQQLSRLCDANERLEFHTLGTETTVEHGEALDELLAIEPSELFTFMDSDIFATAPVSMTDIGPLPGEVASSACLPVWYQEHDSCMPASFQFMGGRYTTSATGHFLGCTYLASYRSRPLREFAASTGLSFRRYNRRNLPTDVLRKLEEIGLGKRLYDTGKVMNIMLQREGHKMSFRDIDGLVHVGGVSAKLNERPHAATGLKRAIKFVLPRPMRDWVNRQRFGYTQIEADDMADLYERRIRACDLIAGLSAGPPFSANTTALIEREAYARQIVELFAAYGDNKKPGDRGTDAEQPGGRSKARHAGFLH